MLQRFLASNGTDGQRPDDDDGTDDGTDGQRTDDDDGRTWADGQRTDNDDGTDGRTDRGGGRRRRLDTTGHDGTDGENIQYLPKSILMVYPSKQTRTDISGLATKNSFLALLRRHGRSYSRAVFSS